MSSVIQEIPLILLKGSLLCSQQSTTYCYPEPDPSRPLPPSCFLIIRLNLSSHLRLGLQISLFPCGLPTKLNAPLPVIRSHPRKSSLFSLFIFRWHPTEHRTAICVLRENYSGISFHTHTHTHTQLSWLNHRGNVWTRALKTMFLKLGFAEPQCSAKGVSGVPTDENA